MISKPDLISIEYRYLLDPRVCTKDAICGISSLYSTYTSAPASHDMMHISTTYIENDSLLSFDKVGNLSLFIDTTSLVAHALNTCTGLENNPFEQHTANQPARSRLLLEIKTKSN